MATGFEPRIVQKGNKLRRLTWNTSGIRLLSDPTFNGIKSDSTSGSYGRLDAHDPLAFNRIIPPPRAAWGIDRRRLRDA